MDDISFTSYRARAGLIELTVDVVSVYISNNSVSALDVPALLSAVYAAISGLKNLAAGKETEITRPTPRQIRKSITPDALISFEDGKPYKTLKRSLARLGLSPEQYRQKWGLPGDYPMVAPSYSEARSSLAKSLGLGLQRRKSVSRPADATRTAKIGNRTKASGPAHPSSRDFVADRLEGGAE